jgi:hypothetical protein
MSTPDLMYPISDPSHILEDLTNLNSHRQMGRYLEARGRRQEAHWRRQRELAHQCMVHEAILKHARDRKPTHADQRAVRRNPLYSRALDHSGINDGAIGKTQQGIPANQPLNNILSASSYFGSGGSTP